MTRSAASTRRQDRSNGATRLARLRKTPAADPLATPDRSRRSSAPAVGSDAAIMREGEGAGILLS